MEGVICGHGARYFTGTKVCWLETQLCTYYPVTELSLSQVHHLKARIASSLQGLQEAECHVHALCVLQSKRKVSNAERLSIDYDLSSNVTSWEEGFPVHALKIITPLPLHHLSLLLFTPHMSPWHYVLSIHLVICSLFVSPTRNLWAWTSVYCCLL